MTLLQSPTRSGAFYARISIPTYMKPSQALALYRELNSDLPFDVLRALEPFALAPRLRRRGLEQMFTGINCSTPSRHRAWFYWNCLDLSGLGRFWAGPELNDGRDSISTWMRRIALNTTEEEQQLLCRRLFRRCLKTGAPVSDPVGRRKNYWTKGGNWPVGWGMSQIVVMHRHMPRRPEQWWSVSDAKMHMFERELMTLVDPDKMLQPDAYFQIQSYALQRYPHIRGVKLQISRIQLPWLFQQDIQTEGRNKWHLKSGYLSTREGRAFSPKRLIEW